MEFIIWENTESLLKTSPYIEHAFYVCEYQLTAYNDALFQHHNILFEADNWRAVDKRKAEFLAGRLAASRALHGYGLAEQGKRLARGEKREPLWPSGIHGAITHTKHLAAALVTPSSSVQGVGIDIESCIVEETMLNIKRQITSDEEWEIVNSQANRCAAFTYVFSAKESFFKAAFPQVRKYFGFDALRLKSFEDNHLEFVVAEHLHANLPIGKNITIQCAPIRDALFTGLILTQGV